MHLHYPVKTKYIKAFLNEYGNTVKTAIMDMLKNGPSLCERDLFAKTLNCVEWYELVESSHK